MSAEDQLQWQLSSDILLQQKLTLGNNWSHEFDDSINIEWCVYVYQLLSNVETDAEIDVNMIWYNYFYTISSSCRV